MQVPVYKFEFLTSYFTARVQYEYRNFLVRPSFPGRAYVPPSSYIHFLCGYVTVEARLT